MAGTIHGISRLEPETGAGPGREKKMESGRLEGVGVVCLPDKKSISPFLRDLLNQTFNCVDDLATTPSLLARLQQELERDNEEFRRVEAEALVTAKRGTLIYDQLAKILHRLGSEIENGRASTLSSGFEHVGNDAGSGIGVSASAQVQRELERENEEFRRATAEVLVTADDAGSGTAVVDDVDVEVSEWDDFGRDFCSSEIEKVVNPNIAEKRLADDGVFDQQPMVKELGALANEVARVERVRIYAESVLKLEQLIGDLEAAVALVSGSSSKAGNAASSLRITRAVQRMQSTEEAVAEIARGGWKCLVSAVDLRLDRVASILRPAAIADHRGTVTSLGWPPPLSAGGGKLSNPFLECSDDQERKYGESLMALTILQAVQQNRRDRQLHLYGDAGKGSLTSSGIGSKRGRSNRSAREPLWAVEELISPLASKVEPHFLRWTTKPELVFALAYRIAQAYVDDIDEFLQPVIDKSKLVGYSAREEWVFSLVNMVSMFLKSHVLPGLANDVLDGSGTSSVGSALWLHIVDQTLAFDNRMKSLAVRASGLFQGGEADQDTENLSVPAVLSISAIAEREDWLVLWAKLEVKDVLEKLKGELKSEVAWSVRGKSGSILGLVERVSQAATVPVGARVGDFRAPLGAEIVLSSMSAVCDRCRSLSESDQQYKFIKHGVMPIASEYHQELLRRCDEVQAVSPLNEESSMVTVSTCVNAARFCAQGLKDWGENIFFLELFRRQQKCSEGWEDLDGSIFDEEIENFELLREVWVGKLVSSISREFDSRCRDYFRNKKRWIEVGRGNVGLDSVSKVKNIISSEELDGRQRHVLDENQANVLSTFYVSASLVDALAVLESHLRIIQAVLDNVNFFELWRNVALELDELVFNAIVLSGAKFSENGGWQFAADMQALFLVFKPYCVRPSGFFKSLRDSVKLLTLPSQEVSSLVDSLGSLEKPKFQKDSPSKKNLRVPDGLKLYGVRKLPPATAKRILSSRVISDL